MAALPILKLFFLGVKQLSKPVAGFIKNRAKNSPTFKEHVINAAQLWHRVSVRASQAASNASAETRAIRIKPLDEATAVATFTDILGEGVIYFVAAVALVVEYQMSSEKDAKKAAALESRFKNAETELENRRKESEALRTELKCSQEQLFHISQDMLDLLRGYSMSPEAVAVRQTQLAAYVASTDGFADEFARRTAVSPPAGAPLTTFNDRWLKRIQSLLNSSSVTSASEHEKK